MVVHRISPNIPIVCILHYHGQTKSTVPQEHRRKRTYATDTDDSVQWMYTEYPPTSPLFVYCITMGKQNALFHKLLSLDTLHQAPRETDTLMVTILVSIKHNLRRKKGRMVPKQMMVYNSCTQNNHQHPHCVYITLPWRNKKHCSTRTPTEEDGCYRYR